MSHGPQDVRRRPSRRPASTGIRETLRKAAGGPVATRPQNDLFPNVQNPPARQCINARCQQIGDAWRRVDDLLSRRARIPRRIPVQSLTPEPVVKLAPEIQHLTNRVKMVAYQAECELVRTISPHYRRVAEED